MISALKKAFRKVVASLPPQASLRLQFIRFHRRWPRFASPRSFSEKVQHRKLFERDDRFTRLADKVEVKEYVAEKLGAGFVIPTLWQGTRLPPVENRDWPVPFVIKANHGSGWNAFVWNEQDRNWPDIERLCEEWLGSRMPRYLHETWYERIEPRLLVEPLIHHPAQSSLIDYKFFVFSGKAQLVQIDTGRHTRHKRAFYDCDWKRQDLSLKYPEDKSLLDKPRHFDEMRRAAEIIGADFPFARVDFYDLPDGPRFGEITFAPGSGLERFSPASFDRKLGKFWNQATR